jgi:predicted neuraminidase
MRSPRVQLFAAIFALSIGPGVCAGPQEAGNTDARAGFDGQFRPAAPDSTLAGTETAYLPALFASSHAANLLLLANGDLLCFWFSGAWEGESGVAIVMSRLPAGSNRWTQTQVIDQKPGKSYQNPVAFQSHDGRVWLLHTAQTANRGQGDAQVWSLISTDNGITWTAPSLLFAEPGSFTRHPPLLDASRWVLPVSFTPGAGLTGERSLNYAAFELSTDEGKTWHECAVPGTNGLLTQPSVVHDKAGAYIAFFRSLQSDWIYRATSADGCKWSHPQPTQLPNNNASVQAFRLRNGHLVIAFDNSGPYLANGRRVSGPRKPLSIALSLDDGKTWPWVRDLETGDTATKEWNSPPGHDEYSYPTVVEDARGRIVVAYSWQRSTIKVVRFSESWIKAAATVGSFRGDSRNPAGR